MTEGPTKDKRNKRAQERLAVLLGAAALPGVSAPGGASRAQSAARWKRPSAREPAFAVLS